MEKLSVAGVLIAGAIIAVILGGTSAKLKGDDSAIERETRIQWVGLGSYIVNAQGGCK